MQVESVDCVIVPTSRVSGDRQLSRRVACQETVNQADAASGICRKPKSQLQGDQSKPSAKPVRAFPSKVPTRSVWWSGKAPVNGTVVLTTAGSTFDTLLAVYTGSSYPLTYVASNNDDPDPVLKDQYGGFTSSLTFSATE